MATVLLGNSAALDNGEPLSGHRITTVHLPDHLSRQEHLRTLFHADGLWAAHSASPTPDWVESDDDALATAVSAVTGCPIGRPGDWEGE